MNYSTIEIDFNEHVAHIQMSRPDVMNSLNQELGDELFHCVNELDANEDVRVIVLSGAGKAFCAGGDISFLQVISGKSNTGIRRLVEDISHKLTALARVEKPVIGALHGFVLGAGLGLALLCDLRVASDGTKFSAEFPMMGIIPELGLTHTLSGLVGLGKAMELVLTARRFEANEAEKLGMINRVVPEDKLIAEVMAMANHIASLPPLAIGLSKIALRRGAKSSLEESAHFEADINALCYQTEDHKEAASAFLEKRKPHFRGL